MDSDPACEAPSGEVQRGLCCFWSLKSLAVFPGRHGGTVPRPPVKRSPLPAAFDSLVSHCDQGRVCSSAKHARLETAWSNRPGSSTLPRSVFFVRGAPWVRVRVSKTQKAEFEPLTTCHLVRKRGLKGKAPGRYPGVRPMWRVRVRVPPLPLSRLDHQADVVRRLAEDQLAGFDSGDYHFVRPTPSVQLGGVCSLPKHAGLENQWPAQGPGVGFSLHPPPFEQSARISRQPATSRLRVCS